MQIQKLRNVWMVLLFPVSLLTFSSCATKGEMGKSSREWPLLRNKNDLIITQIPQSSADENFLLDSGSRFTFLKGEFLSQNRSQFHKLEKDLGGENRLEIKDALMRWDFSRGGVSFNKIFAKEGATERYSNKVDGYQCCTGILGIDFFKKYSVEVNRDRNRIYFRDPYRDLPLKDWYEIPLVFDETNQVMKVQCKSSLGPSVNLLFDTGLDFPLVINDFFANKVDLAKKLKGKIISLHRDRFQLSLGNLRCGPSAPSWNFPALYLNTGVEALDRSDGRLSTTLLGGHFIIDLLAGKIWIRKEGYQPELPEIKIKTLKADFPHLKAKKNSKEK